MTIEIHGVVFSPPCRLVYMTLDVLGIQYKSVYCHPFKGMNKTPEYLKLNPQHNIPALVDGKLVLNESRAIATYLAGMAGSYGGNSQLYPSDLKIRAVIDQRLHFDLGTFYQTFMDNTVSSGNRMKEIRKFTQKNNLFFFFSNFSSNRKMLI